MRQVLLKQAGQIFEVFDVTYDVAGRPRFLIYKDDTWIQMCADLFTPHFYETFNGTYEEI